MNESPVSRSIAFLLAAGLAAVTLAGCGTRTVHGSASGDGTQAFTARARQVVAQWTRSPAARVWRTGLVLLSPDELTSIPANAGFADQRQKQAFGSGHFTLSGTLPSSQLTGRVRWSTGAAMTVPLLTARAAFGQLATNQACSIPPCGHLTVTAAQPADLTVLTSRGPATVPAWRFIVAELPFPVTRAAVAPAAYSTLPAGPPPGGGLVPGVAGVPLVSADGKLLTLEIVTGVCLSGWGGRVYSTAAAVVVGSWSRASNTGEACPAMAVSRKVNVQLAQPLGTRVILDAGSGLPLVPGLR